MGGPVRDPSDGTSRLRFVNASNARVYRLFLDPPPPGGKDVIQNGSDVGLLAQPVRLNSFAISPGERYDVLVDFAAYRPGTPVLLRNELSEDDTTYVVRFDVARRVRGDARVPDTLTTDTGPPLPAALGVDRRFASFSGPEGTGLPGQINLKTFDPVRIDAQPTLGSIEIWDITADPTHPVHIHMAHFRVLGRDGGPPAAQDGGWKDTIFVPEGGVRLAVNFAGYRGKDVFHCHNLEHGDNGMMTNVEVV